MLEQFAVASDESTVVTASDQLGADPSQAP